MLQISIHFTGIDIKIRLLLETQTNSDFRFLKWFCRQYGVLYYNIKRYRQRKNISLKSLGPVISLFTVFSHGIITEHFCNQLKRKPTFMEKPFWERWPAFIKPVLKIRKTGQDPHQRKKLYLYLYPHQSRKSDPDTQIGELCTREGPNMESSMVCRPVVADSHNFDKEQYPTASKWKVGSGSATKWKEGSGSKIKVMRICNTAFYEGSGYAYGLKTPHLSCYD
jgi:hypothetical protein